MTEKIGVTYLSVDGVASHMALFYENSAGQKLVIEAGPQFNIDRISDVAAAAVSAGEFAREVEDTLASHKR